MLRRAKLQLRVVQPPPLLGLRLTRPVLRCMWYRQRFREIPLTRGTFEDGLFQDMMWSDPQDDRGVRPSTRGAGHFFGKDVTAAFCRSNNLHLVIRSHECVQDGFEFTHKTQLLTLFSASNYCGDTDNMGAFVVFKSADMQANIEQFMASAPANTGPSKLARTHKAVIAKLIDLICASKHDLYWYFSHLDSRHTGTVRGLRKSADPSIPPALALGG